MPLWQIITCILIFIFIIFLLISSFYIIKCFFVKKKLNIYLKKITELLNECYAIKNNLLNIMSRYMKSEKSIINRLNEIEESYKKLDNINEKLKNIKLLYAEFSYIITLSEAYPNLIKEQQFVLFKENSINNQKNLKLTINSYNGVLKKYIKLHDRFLNKIKTKENYNELISL